MLCFLSDDDDLQQKTNGIEIPWAKKKRNPDHPYCKSYQIYKPTIIVSDLWFLVFFLLHPKKKAALSTNPMKSRYSTDIVETARRHDEIHQDIHPIL